MRNYSARMVLLLTAFGFVWFCAVGVAPVFAAESEKLLEEIKAGADREYSSLERLYRHLHKNPELSLHEEKTSARIAAELRDAGFEVTERVGGYGVVGVMRNGAGPVVLVRTDMDALPITEETDLPYASRVKTQNDQGRTVGVMHACGHDIHMTVFTGVARLMSDMKGSWKGRLVMIGQPAEELGLGARAMLADGLFERFGRPDYMLALHIMPDMAAGTTGYVEGYAMAAVDFVDITVRGSGGHGATPHKTKDPIVTAAQIVLALQTIVSREVNPIESAVVTVGQIHGGTKANIIPDEVELDLTVRTYSNETRDQILAAIKRICDGIAKAAGVPDDRMPVVKTDDRPVVYAVYNTPNLVRRSNAVIGRIIGKENVTAVEPTMVGEDFSEYYYRCQSASSYFFFLGTTESKKIKQSVKGKIDLPGLHTSRLAPAAEPTIKTGVKAMTSAVLDLMYLEKKK